MAKNEQQVCTFCGKPVMEKPSGVFHVPVCGSEECLVKYYEAARRVYAFLDDIARWTLL